MGDIRLTAPRIRVVRDGLDDLEIQTDNRDLLAYERTRLRQKPVWPKFEDAPFQWLTFLSWSAARRAGLVDVTYAQWEATVLDASAADQADTTGDDDGDEVGRPTGPGPEPG